jgi:hypothetical protein
MIGKLTTAAALATAVATLAAVAAAGQVASKQRVAVQVKGGAFVLNPLTSGAVKPDSGTATFCCWTSRSIVRDGQAVEIDDPRMTLTGKRGTLVARNRIEFVGLPDGWAVFTGTWKVIRGTGDYARLVGGGRGAGITLANSNGKSQFQGFLGLK